MQGLDQSWNSGRRHIAQQITQGGLLGALTGLLRAQFVFLGPAGRGRLFAAGMSVVVSAIEPRDGVAKQEKALSEYQVYVAEHYASKDLPERLETRDHGLDVRLSPAH